MKNAQIEQAIDEFLIEKNWELQRRFMHEVIVELDIEGKLPVNLVMCSQNVVQKWLEWARLN